MGSGFLKYRWLIISSVSGMLALALVADGLWRHPSPSVYGEQFILDEWSPVPFIQFKPMTLIFIFVFLFYAFLIQHLEARIALLSRDVRTFLFVISFLIAFGSLYELFFNFTLWSALMSVTGVANPDILVNRFPNPKTAVSIVYASKLVLLIFSVSAYSLYFLHRIGGGASASDAQ
ncbi:hypothetical protein KEJ39_03420 [Candidatus Bathyarchaeota archaeon]|nr:hypothetical protein [Candidatus Bathyarchaeota archaeon]